MAREGAEEFICFTGFEFGNVKRDRVFFASPDNLGMGDHAGVAVFEVAFVDTGGDAISSDGLRVSLFAQHPVMTHHVLRQAAREGQFYREGFAGSNIARAQLLHGPSTGR